SPTTCRLLADYLPTACRLFADLGGHRLGLDRDLAQQARGDVRVADEEQVGVEQVGAGVATPPVARVTLCIQDAGDVDQLLQRGAKTGGQNGRVVLARAAVGEPRAGFGEPLDGGLDRDLAPLDGADRADVDERDAPPQLDGR